MLEKAKYDRKDPHLTILEARNKPVDNYRSPAELAIRRQLRLILPVNANNLKMKTVDNDELKEIRRKDKEKQSKYDDQHTKEMKELRSGKGVRMLRDRTWEPVTILEKADEPRSYILKIENGRTYRRNDEIEVTSWKRK